MEKTRAVLVGLIILFPALVMAQGASIELTPTIGYRWGGEILAEDNDLFAVDVEVEDSQAFGLILDIPVTRSLQIELLVDRQSTDFGQDRLFSPDDFELGVDLTYYHVGVLWQWHTRDLVPFVVGSVGLAQIEPDLAGVEDEERFSASIGGGFKVPITDHFGFRFELRGFWTDTDKGDCHWYEDDEYCWDDWHNWNGDDDLVQGEVKVGFVFRF